MKCKFCAEEIQDSAILCRYCGARLHGSQWLAPERHPSNNDRTGTFTIKLAALFFVVAAVLELSDPVGVVPLFGAARGGSVAFFYHLVSAILFLLAGLGLLEGSQRGLKAFYAMTAYYSVQQLLYIADTRAIEALLKQHSEISSVAGLIDTGTIVDTVRLAGLAMLLCTWGFALYIYYHRDYFRSS